MTQSASQVWEPGPAAQMCWLQLWLGAGWELRARDLPLQVKEGEATVEKAFPTE